MQELYAPLIERAAPASGAVNVVIICEHASNIIPERFQNLGLDTKTLKTHIAWDPGALGVAQELRRRLRADLVAGSVSRLLYDCNRPPEAPSAMPEMSEIFEIPGNRNLSQADREARTNAIYAPYCKALMDILDERATGVLITVHSFTPVYHGVRRECEIGVLHDSDSRLADAILAVQNNEFPYNLDRNVPYSASDGVTHTLKTFAVARGWPNVMLEIRNDLIETGIQQKIMAGHLAALLEVAISNLKEAENV